MKKILTIAGSNSSKSINVQLVQFAGTLLKDRQVDNLDLLQYNTRVYNADEEEKEGVPKQIVALFDLLKTYDGFIIATPEHNGGLPAFFKNILDWLSRIDRDIFGDKPVCLLATSPGGYGAASALKTLSAMLPRFGADVKSEYSLVSFYDNFDVEKQKISNEEELTRLDKVVQVFLS